MMHASTPGAGSIGTAAVVVALAATWACLPKAMPSAVDTAVAGLKEVVDYAFARLAAFLTVLPRHGGGARHGRLPSDRGTSPREHGA
jgi:hypothetical protein